MIRLAPQFAELAATTNFSFCAALRTRRRWWRGRRSWVLRGSASPIATRWPASCARMCSRAKTARRWERCASSSARGSSSPTRRPNSSSIPRRGPAMAGCAGCSRQEICARRRASAISDFADALEDTQGLRVIAMPGGGRGERAKLQQLREAFGVASLDRREPRLWRGDARRAGAARPARREISRAADRDQRRADACSRAAAARRCRRLHPRGRDPGGGGPADAGQRRAPSEGPARNGAPVRRGAGGGRRDARLSCAASTSVSTNSPTAIPRSCAKATSVRRPRSKRSPSEGVRSALSRGRARARHPGAQARARSRSAAQLRALFPHRPRHREVRALARHSLPGARLGRQFDALLLPRHHRGRSGALRSAVRAFRLRRAQRAARHRRRFRARAARRGHPVHLCRDTAASAPGSPRR